MKKTTQHIAEQRTQLKEQLKNIFINDKEKLISFIKIRVNNTEEAEDILQDVFANMITMAISIQEPIENVRAWVYASIRNKIIDTYRKNKPETFTELFKASDEEKAFFLEENLITSSENPESIFLKKITIEAIQEALNKLPEEQRFVFEKHEIEGVPFKTLAAETGVKINTLLARKRYAIIALRHHLKEIYNS